MLHARIDVAQIMDRFQIGCEITEFHHGLEPDRFYMKPVILDLEGEALSQDALSIIISAIRLWSEMTNS